MAEDVSMRPLTDEEYAKTKWREKQRNLPYEEKVRQVIEMQKRVAPIYRARGIAFRVWQCEE